MENFSLPIQPAFAHAFVQDWADAWNTHDLDRILAYLGRSPQWQPTVVQAAVAAGDPR